MSYSHKPRQGQVYYLPTATGRRSSRRVRILRRAGIDGVECMYVQDDGSDGEAVTLSEEFLSNWCWRAFDDNTDGACA